MKTDDAGQVVALPAIQLEGPYWVIPNYYTQICQTITYQVCCKTGTNDYERHSAKFKGTILPVITHNGEPIDQSSMFDPYIDILDKRVNELVVAAGDIQIDSELKNDSGNPVQNRIVKAAIDELKEDVAGVNGRLDQLDGGGMTEEAKQALLNLVSHIGLWDDDHGQDYIDALEAALYPPASLTRITAVYTQSDVVYEGSELNNLKADLIVTAVYSDSTSEVITAYTLTGTLEEGTSTITVSYGGKTTTFDVTVTGQLLPSGYRQIEYVGADGGQIIATSIKPREYPIRIETRFHKTSQAGSEQALVMCKNGNATLFELGYSGTANTMFAYSSASATITNPIVNGNVADIVAEFNSASPYKTLSITANGETVTAQNTTANATGILNNTPLNLFAAGTNANGIYGRMYSCKIYSGSNLLGDFIPCYSESEERAGMYDLVTETFYKSTGARAFIKGGDV